MAKDRTFSVIPSPDTTSIQEGLTNISDRLAQGDISQKELNRLLLQQLLIMNEHLSAMTGTENSTVARDITQEGKEDI